MKPILVGESNPYGDDPAYALYPYPEGYSGHRLSLILGMCRGDYLKSFCRTNLCTGRWSLPLARQAAMRLRWQEAKLVLLGSKVATAFEVEFVPFGVQRGMLVLPHPSGLCRLWNDPKSVGRARRAVLDFVPNLSPLVGALDARVV